MNAAPALPERGALSPAPLAPPLPPRLLVVAPDPAAALDLARSARLLDAAGAFLPGLVFVTRAAQIDQALRRTSALLASRHLWPENRIALHDRALDAIRRGHLAIAPDGVLVRIRGAQR